MSIFESSDPLATTPLEQRFQAELGREILISQRLRASILGGIFGFAIVFLLGCLIYFKAIRGEPFFPMPLILFSFVMMLYQLGLRYSIDWAIRSDVQVPGWFFYFSAGIEISIITGMFLFFRTNMEDWRLLLSSPPLLIYTVFIALSTLRLDFKMSLFVGGLAGLEYLAVSRFFFSRMADGMTGIGGLQFVYYSWIRAFILMMCGVGCAFVARQVRQRVLRSFLTIAEREHEEAASRAKSMFLANVSHEMRTPLNAILGYAQLMADDESLSSQQRQSMDHISTNGNHLRTLINNMLDAFALDLSPISESDKNPAEESESDRVDLSDVVLPEPLLQALQEAASSFNMTRFNRHLDEIESMGPSEKEMVAPLRQLSLNYDMKAILEALKEIKHD